MPAWLTGGCLLLRLSHLTLPLVAPQTDPNAPVHEVVHQIEAVLDILQEETERHAQQKVAEHGGVTNSKSTTKHPSVSRRMSKPLNRHHVVGACRL